MAKSPAISSRPALRPRINAALVRRQVQQFYDLGLRVRKADSKATKLGEGIRNWGVPKQFAKKHSRDQIEKARMFVQLYTQKDLESLLSLGTDSGVPLGRRHVTYLLSVKKKAERRRLQERASKEEWSTRKLAVEIKKLHGKKSTGGRMLSAAADRDEALIQIESMSSQWIRWYRRLRSAKMLDSRSAASRALEEIMPLIEGLQRTVARPVGAEPLRTEEELPV